MDIENMLRTDLWKAIEAHYERCDYTEAVRDALFYVCEFLREISGLENVDGTKLVESTLLGKNPIIQINKNETTTEKDIQQGIGFALKGLMMASRNPLSHEKTEYTQNEAESIIAYTNYVLNQIDHSGGYKKIDNVTQLLYDEDFTSTKEYADLLLKEIPIKKRYDLLVELYNNRVNLNPETLGNFINALYGSLSKSDKANFIKLLNSSLLLCKDDQKLCMYLHYFMEATYDDLDKLVQLRVESLIYKSVVTGKIEEKYDTESNSLENECTGGRLATWIGEKTKFEHLGNADIIRKELIADICIREETKKEYALTFFADRIFENISLLSDCEIDCINRKLNAGDSDIYNALYKYMFTKEEPKYEELFGEAFNECCLVI